MDRWFHLQIENKYWQPFYKFHKQLLFHHALNFSHEYFVIFSCINTQPKITLNYIKCIRSRDFPHLARVPRDNTSTRLFTYITQFRLIFWIVWNRGILRLQFPHNNPPLSHSLIRQHKISLNT
jgi:hypothetical protein